MRIGILSVQGDSDEHCNALKAINVDTQLVRLSKHLDNIEGFDLFNIIGYSKKVVAFHGMMTNLASLFKKPVLDLFHFNISNWTSYRNARNFFYEFKPIYKNYDFIIPKKNFSKTLKKMKFSFKV